MVRNWGRGSGKIGSKAAVRLMATLAGEQTSREAETFAGSRGELFGLTANSAIAAEDLERSIARGVDR
jgi:hypothetical protein